MILSRHSTDYHFHILYGALCDAVKFSYRKIFLMKCFIYRRIILVKAFYLVLNTYYIVFISCIFQFKDFSSFHYYLSVRYVVLGILQILYNDSKPVLCMHVLFDCLIYVSVLFLVVVRFSFVNISDWQRRLQGVLHQSRDRDWLGRPSVGGDHR